MFLLAVIIKPQGIKGEVKAKYFPDQFADTSVVREAVVGGKTMTVEKLRLDGNFIIIKLKGVDDRNAAELLRGQEVYVDEKNRPQLGEDRFYISDVIGCKLFADGNELGVVTDVIQNGGADIWEVGGEKPFMFAYVEGVIIKYDIPNKTLEADAAELKKVAVYED